MSQSEILNCSRGNCFGGRRAHFPSKICLCRLQGLCAMGWGVSQLSGEWAQRAGHRTSVDVSGCPKKCLVYSWGGVEVNHGRFCTRRATRALLSWLAIDGSNTRNMSCTFPSSRVILGIEIIEHWMSVTLVSFTWDTLFSALIRLKKESLVIVKFDTRLVHGVPFLTSLCHALTTARATPFWRIERIEF